MKLTKQQALDKIEELKNYIGGIDNSRIPIITYQESKNFWGFIDAMIPSEITYSDEVLAECAKENEKGSLWRLIYIHGYSLKELKAKHPSFFYSQSWYENQRFAEEKAVPGYYLLNFQKQLTNMTWEKQQLELINKGLSRAPLAAVIEATIALKEIQGEKVLEDWYHWSPALSSRGNLVYFGKTVSKGAHLGGWSPHDSRDGIGVVSVRSS